MNSKSIKPTVLITESLEPICADWLSERALTLWCPHDSPDLNAYLSRSDGLVVRTYTQVHAEMLTQAPHLKVVARAGVGLENIDLNACRHRKVTVVYTPDANTQAVAEYVIGLILDAMRPRTDLSPDATAQQFHELRRSEIGTQLDQHTLGIVGFGRIGKRLGSMGHAIGMKLLVCDLLPEAPLRQAVDYPFGYVDHATLYAQSHVVSLHVDGRPANHRMLNVQMLKHLRDDCLLLNTARGMLIDPMLLARWAQDHPRARVILDVHDPEPPPINHPLRRLQNARLLPHLASRTGIAMKNMGWVVKDLIGVLNGRPPPHPAPTCL